MLKIDSATFASGENRLDVSGQASRVSDGYLIDIDVRGDTLTIPNAILEARREKDGDEVPTSSKVLDRLAAIQVSGRVAVNLQRVRFGGLDIAPFIAVGRHLNWRADLQIANAALCGISMKGAATLLPDGVSLQTTLSARNQPIGESIPCLTERRVQLTGNFDLDAQVSAQGEMRGIANALRGSYSITARDGRILEFTTLDKVFGILNVTRIVAGKLPNLRETGMAYTSASARGTIQGTKVVCDECALNAQNVTVAAQGTVDQETDQINATLLVAPLPTINWIESKLPDPGAILRHYGVRDSGAGQRQFGPPYSGTARSPGDRDALQGHPVQYAPASRGSHQRHSRRRTTPIARGLRATTTVMRKSKLARGIEESDLRSERYARPNRLPVTTGK